MKADLHRAETEKQRGHFGLQVGPRANFFKCGETAPHTVDLLRGIGARSNCFENSSLVYIRQAALFNGMRDLLMDVSAFARILCAHWIEVILGLLFLRFLRNRFRPVLYKIPGPFLASVSDLWLFFHAYNGNTYKEYEMHRKYNSSLLRLGPNTVAVADPAAIRIIYGYKKVFNKVLVLDFHDQNS
jgi:hypothetical protein